VNQDGEEQVSKQKVREGQGRRQKQRQMLRLSPIGKSALRSGGVLIPSDPTPEQLEYVCKIFSANRRFHEDRRLVQVAEMLKRCEAALNKAAAVIHPSKTVPSSDKRVRWNWRRIPKIDAEALGGNNGNGHGHVPKRDSQ